MFLRYILFVSVALWAALMHAEQRAVTIAFDTPGSGYAVEIVEAYQVGDELWVVSQVKSPPRGSIGLTVITPVSDELKLDADKDLKLRHKVIGKTWKWGQDTEVLQWVKDLATLDVHLNERMGTSVWQRGGAKGAVERRSANAGVGVHER